MVEFGPIRLRKHLRGGATGLCRIFTWLGVTRARFPGVGCAPGPPRRLGHPQIVRILQILVEFGPIRLRKHLRSGATGLCRIFTWPGVTQARFPGAGCVLGPPRRLGHPQLVRILRILIGFGPIRLRKHPWGGGIRPVGIFSAPRASVGSPRTGGAAPGPPSLAGHPRLFPIRVFGSAWGSIFGCWTGAEPGNGPRSHFPVARPPGGLTRSPGRSAATPHGRWAPPNVPEPSPAPQPEMRIRRMGRVPIVQFPRTAAGRTPTVVEI